MKAPLPAHFEDRAQEIDRRIREVKAGRVRLVPAPEAFRAVRASLREARERRARRGGA